MLVGELPRSTLPAAATRVFKHLFQSAQTVKEIRVEMKEQ
jgi:hypothetical protein